jgi:hypothetical protein
MSCREALAASRAFTIVTDPVAFGQRDNTRTIERERRQKAELVVKHLENVHEFEQRHNLGERWTKDSIQWREAEVLVKHRTYRRNLDTLEGLIVARMFELMKMNMSKTGECFFYLSG